MPLCSTTMHRTANALRATCCRAAFDSTKSAASGIVLTHFGGDTAAFGESAAGISPQALPQQLMRTIPHHSASAADARCAIVGLRWLRWRWNSCPQTGSSLGACTTRHSRNITNTSPTQEGLTCNGHDCSMHWTLCCRQPRQ